MSRFAWLSLAVLALACSGRRSDPPPPAASAVVPMAPPHAIGAMAAGHTPEPSLAPPADPDEEPSDETAPPSLTPTPSDPDSGVSL